eukprot:jgi/Botrbrau1/21562/Bobra.174_2s0061.2
MHKNKIIHRDIKPENLLVTADSVLKIADFGFARYLDKHSERSEYVATRWYRAPELLVGDPLYGFPVDIWAVGCMAFEMLTGEPVFRGASDIDQLSLMCHSLGTLPLDYANMLQRSGATIPPPAPDPVAGPSFSDWIKSLPGDAGEFILACLQLDPIRRPTSSQLANRPFLKGVRAPRIQRVNDFHWKGIGSSPVLKASGSVISITASSVTASVASNPPPLQVAQPAIPLGVPTDMALPPLMNETANPVQFSSVNYKVAAPMYFLGLPEALPSTLPSHASSPAAGGPNPAGINPLTQRLLDGIHAPFVQAHPSSSYSQQEPCHSWWASREEEACPHRDASYPKFDTYREFNPRLLRDYRNVVKVDPAPPLALLGSDGDLRGGACGNPRGDFHAQEMLPQDGPAYGANSHPASPPDTRPEGACAQPWPCLSPRPEPELVTAAQDPAGEFLRWPGTTEKLSKAVPESGRAPPPQATLALTAAPEPSTGTALCSAFRDECTLLSSYMPDNVFVELSLQMQLGLIAGPDPNPGCFAVSQWPQGATHGELRWHEAEGFPEHLDADLALCIHPLEEKKEGRVSSLAGRVSPEGHTLTRLAGHKRMQSSISEPLLPTCEPALPKRFKRIRTISDPHAQPLGAGEPQALGPHLCSGGAVVLNPGHESSTSGEEVCNEMVLPVDVDFCQKLPPLPHPKPCSGLVPAGPKEPLLAPLALESFQKNCRFPNYLEKLPCKEPWYQNVALLAGAGLVPLQISSSTDPSAFQLAWSDSVDSADSIPAQPTQRVGKEPEEQCTILDQLRRIIDGRESWTDCETLADCILEAQQGN